jgi:hypothetical protein
MRARAFRVWKIRDMANIKQTAIARKEPGRTDDVGGPRVQFSQWCVNRMTYLESSVYLALSVHKFELRVRMMVT